MKFFGTNTYITGKTNEHKILGDCNVVLDGKYTIDAKYTNDGLLIKNPSKFFKDLENYKNQLMGEIE